MIKEQLERINTAISDIEKQLQELRAQQQDLTNCLTEAKADTISADTWYRMNPDLCHGHYVHVTNTDNGILGNIVTVDPDFFQIDWNMFIDVDEIMQPVAEEDVLSQINFILRRLYNNR